MRIFIKWNGKCFEPVYPSDKDKSYAMEKNVTMIADIKMPRNINHHRKFFAILRLVLDNWPEGDNRKPIDEEALLKLLKYEVGHVDTYRDLRGNIKIEPLSINFLSMDQLSFNSFSRSYL